MFVLHGKMKFGVALKSRVNSDVEPVDAFACNLFLRFFGKVFS